MTRRARGLADLERNLIRTRTAEGRSRAEAQEQQMGRPPPLLRRSRRRPPDGAQSATLCELRTRPELRRRRIDYSSRDAGRMTA
jgi:DNA invertase Pin-like site-specific DNA recombinase